MNLAKISANGQITVPIDIRKFLGVDSGDKILFIPRENGEVVISSASTAMQPLTKKQFLEELEISRKQAESGKTQNAEKAIQILREKYDI